MSKFKDKRWWIVVAAGAIFAIFLLILIPILNELIPQAIHLIKTQDYQELVSYLRSFGWRGAAILFILQFLQSLVPIFPALALQIAAGITYGSILGTLIIVGSNCIANFLVFALLRKFKVKGIDKVLNWKIWRKTVTYFQNQNPSLVVFIFYLFPFLSNSFVPYLASTTKISWKNYLAMMVIAVTPMTAIGVILGDSVVKQDWFQTVIVFFVALGVSVSLYLLRQPVLKFLRSKKP